jgi:hypothetical protein
MQYARDNAAKTKREQERRQTAREWNGNVEPVKITSGGAQALATCAGRHGNERETLKRLPDSPIADGKHRPVPLTHLDAVGSASCKASVETITAGAPTRKDGVRIHVRGRTPATPLYPLVTLCRSMKLAEPTPEFRFHPTRKFRFDYAWPLHMLALEVEGGLWTNGRHSRGSGQLADLEKYSEAAILGWRLLYCTPDQLRNGVALDRIVRALTDREAA